MAPVMDTSLTPTQIAPMDWDWTIAPTAPVCRKHRSNWIGKISDAGWMTLMLACTAECVYRLLWAVQP